MYFANNPDDQDKFSAKGIKAKTNELTYEKFHSALYKDESSIASNVSIRYRNEKIQTMEVRKIGLKNLSVKNYVEEDRITTRPFPAML